MPLLQGLETNIRLLAVAIILLLVGGFTNFYISILGLILLIPALLTPSKKPTSKPVERKMEQPRISQPPFQSAAAQAVQPTAMTMTPDVPHQSMSSQPSSNSALFPNSMFPSLSLVIPAAAPAGEARQPQPESRDELLELGLLLAALKVLSG